jgi:hypothetical protein
LRSWDGATFPAIFQCVLRRSPKSRLWDCEILSGRWFI